MGQKRIVIDASPLFNPRCGIGRTTSTLIQYIAKSASPSQHEIVLFARRALGPTLKSMVELPFPLRQLRLPRLCEPYIRQLRLIQRLCPADLYHATDFYLPLDSQARTVATVYDLIFETSSEDIVDHKRLRQWVRGFASNSRHIITISEFSKAEIVNTYQIDPERVHVIYLGVNREVFGPPNDISLTKDNVRNRFGLRRPYFVSVSCDVGRKNTPRLLRAFKCLLKAGTSLDLVLVWTPPPAIEQEYGTAEFAGRVHFVGKQEEHILRDLYVAAEAVVYPSISEGFGLPVLEAMSCGTPVITSRTTSLPEVGSDAAIYVDPMDIQSIVAALGAIESGATDTTYLREKGLVQASRFSWDKCAQETLAVYQKALEE